MPNPNVGLFSAPTYAATDALTDYPNIYTCRTWQFFWSKLSEALHTYDTTSGNVDNMSTTIFSTIFNQVREDIYKNYTQYTFEGWSLSQPAVSYLYAKLSTGEIAKELYDTYGPKGIWSYPYCPDPVYKDPHFKSTATFCGCDAMIKTAMLDGEPLSQRALQCICKAGYYGVLNLTDATTTGCLACPASGTSVAGQNTTIADCYIDPGDSHTDATGTWEPINKCYYSQ
ncbi:hypothetical protein HDR63_00645 [bacterium]|nr:hypothetical protein [bacterium]